jgi:MazG family protein
MKKLERLLEVVKSLRDPKTGCPWDLQQDHKSLIPFLLEESYEFIHSVKTGETKSMEDELGDVLLQVVLHAQIASETNQFNFESVCENLSNKLVRRHPHVFAREKDNYSIEEIKTNWEKIKKEEREKKGEAPQQKHSFKVKDFPFPSLKVASEIGKKTNKINFDWEGPNQVSYKVEEEWQELKEELASYPRINRDRVEEELGDFLFSAAQLARHLSMDPESVLASANMKFMDRFNKMEELINSKGLSIDNMKQNEMDLYWSEVKRDEH